MKQFGRVTVIVGTLCIYAASALAESPFRDLDFEQACVAAKKEKRVVMIDFYTTWCGPCKMLDRTTWKDAKVRAWLKNKTISIKVDAEKQRKLSAKYHVRAYPTILFLKPDGEKIDRLVGYRKADTFLEEAQSALAGKTSLMRAKEALAGHETDPMKRMAYANTIARDGRNEEALKEYLWCFDHGTEYQPIFSGVRISFLLSYIARLGRIYPPAIKALEQRRDAAEKALLSAPPQKADRKPKEIIKWLNGKLRKDLFDAVLRLNALNNELGRGSETVQIYDRLKKKGKGYSDLRKMVFRVILDPLLKARRYQDIVEDGDNLERWIGWQIDMYRRAKSMSSIREDTAEDLKRRTITGGAKRYEAFIGVGKREVAQEAAQRLIKFAPSSETYVTLIEHAIRAGDNAAAQSLAKQGLKELPENERGAVRTAVAKIGKEKTNAQ